MALNLSRQGHCSLIISVMRLCSYLLQVPLKLLEICCPDASFTAATARLLVPSLMQLWELVDAPASEVMIDRAGRPAVTWNPRVGGLKQAYAQQDEE